MEKKMSEKSVVVNLNEYGKSRRTIAAAESLPLMHACRDLLIDGAIRVLARQTEAMENTLLVMAERSPLIETRTSYYNALGLLNQQSNELLAACKEAYLKSFDIFLTRRDKTDTTETLELSLVDDQDFEATLTLDKATARLRYNCAEELLALDTRIATLLNRQEMPENYNPLGPRVLCESLLDGIVSISIEQNLQVVLLNQFDLVLTTELARIYQSVNHYLADHGILPDLKFGMKARPTRKQITKTQGDPQGDTETEIFNLFEQMARGRSGGGYANGGVPGGGASSGGSSQTAMAAFNLLDSLASLQNGAMPLPGGGMFEFPVLEGSSIQNVLRSLQQNPAMQSANPLDVVMVDAVAMLFDVLFDEDSIPDRLKAQIARLQIPVLKAAMMDRSFFSLRHHPVRRMLDAIALLSVHIPATPSGNERLEAVSRVVTRVLDNFSEDIGIFEVAADELEAMDQTLESTVEAELQPDIEKLQQAERSEVALIVAHDFINRCLGEQPVVQSITDFLRKDWAALLTHDYTVEGETGAHFNSHVETMRELVWSVQPKKDMDARLMLVRILPGLLKRLREGMAQQEIAAEHSEKFFANLVVLHAHAVRPNAQTVPLPETTEAAADEIVAHPASAIAAKAEEAAPQAAAEEIPELEDEYTLHARELVKGDWVEFHYPDRTFRWMRLGWVGGIKNTYLFSDQDGMNSFSISLLRLAEKLRAGEAVIVERKSITESAFSKLMGLFRQQLGYA
jgi:uncharacterized membrane protein YgcG